jgi:1-phosphatidylinositol-4-phosphate 5-kinase
MTLADKDILDWMDQHVIEYFMRDILIGIAFSIKNSKKFEDDLNILKIKKNFDTKKYIEHNINFLNYNLNDDTIKKSDFLDVNITEYAPKSFAYLRKEENIDIDEMIESFLPINNKEGIKESQGKSGSFFISTDDNKYMIKTLKEGEFNLLRESFLKYYIEYISENGDSLLCRLYGLYKLTMVKGQDFLLIVMRNVIGDYHKNITVKYDVKGCTYGRKVKIDDVPSHKIKNLTLKDINFIEMEKKIKFKEEYIKPFVKSIRKDGQFLRQMKVMDYSLFIVKINLNDYEYLELFQSDSSKLEADSKNYVNVDIYDKMDTLSLNNLNLSLNVKSKNNYIHDCECFRIYIFPSTEDNTAYILSIIDYFQSYNIKKKLESTYKVGIKGKDSETISCVDPNLYSKRFVNFMTEISGYKESGSDDMIIKDNENLNDKDEKLLNKINDNFDDDDKDKLNIE